MTNKIVNSRLVIVKSHILQPKHQNFDLYTKLLVSLYHACGINENRVLEFIETLNNLSDSRKYKLYIDSGGYSIIAGLIEKEQINGLINAYYTFAKNISSETTDYVFSLDIPFSLKHTDLNTVNQIHKYNYLVQERYIEVSNRNKNYRDKALFVWQWKTLNLFKIWREIFYELELYKHYDLYSIGGLVGLKKMQGLNHSPYIIPLLYIFLLIRTYFSDERLKQISQKHDNKYFFHILGQGGSPIEHLLVPILEKYIQKIYNFPTPIYMTFDTASIEISFISVKDSFLIEYENGEYKLYNLKDPEVFDKQNNKISNVEKARYYMYLTRMYYENYFRERYLDTIIDDLINIKNQMQLITFLQKYQQLLLNDNIIMSQTGATSISEFITGLSYIGKHKIKYVDKNKHTDIPLIEKLMETYIRDIVKLPELLK